MGGIPRTHRNFAGFFFRHARFFARKNLHAGKLRIVLLAFLSVFFECFSYGPLSVAFGREYER